jgi:hypothetical protein
MGLTMIYCWVPKVRVIQPNGRPRLFSVPITISELLHLYPRHCVRHVSGSILSADDELEGGSTYMLLPPPRLFPSYSSAHSSCFLHKDKEEETAIGRGGTLIWKPRNRMRVRRDSNQRRSSRISPQEWHNKHSRCHKTERRTSSWQPSLDMISENNPLLKTKDERPVKKKEKKKAKPSKNTFNHSLRNGERASNLQVLVLPGFIY